MQATYSDSVQDTFTAQSFESMTALDVVAPRVIRRRHESRRHDRHGLVKPAVVVKAVSGAQWVGMLVACVAGAVMVGLSVGLIAFLLSQPAVATDVVVAPVVAEPAEQVVAGLNAEVDTASAAVNGMSSTVVLLDRQLSELSVGLNRLQQQQAEIQETVRITKSDLDDVSLGVNNAETIMALAEQHVQATMGL